jgi:hypothetical protein
VNDAGSRFDVSGKSGSLPHRLVRDRVEVLVAEQDVLIFHGGHEVVRHRRSFELYAKVVDPQHTTQGCGGSRRPPTSR